MPLCLCAYRFCLRGSQIFHTRTGKSHSPLSAPHRLRHHRSPPRLARSGVPLRARRRAGAAGMGRIAGAAGAAGRDRRRRPAHHRLPAGAGAGRLRVQGVRGRPGRFLRQVGRPRHLLVLETGRGAHRSLARSGSGVRRPSADPHGRGRKSMKGLWLLVHVIGFTLWLGGGIATMVAGITAKALAPAERLAAYRVIGAIQRLLVGPGAVAVVLSGVIMSMDYMRAGTMPGWLTVMMGAGLLGALLAVGVVVPTASPPRRRCSAPRPGA